MQHVNGRRGPEEHHLLELLRCRQCTLVQLSVIVDPETVFPPDYPYSSGNSKALHANFEDLASQAQPFLGKRDLVVDIGANDGTLLRKFSHRTVGVEPTMQADRIYGPFYRAFFTEQLARQIRREHGPAKVITACNVLAHVDDIHDVMRGIRHLLADDGVLIAENHDLRSVVDGQQWDTIYHEHLRFYDPFSFRKLLLIHGMDAERSQKITTHGGSFRTFVTKGIRHEISRRLGYDFDRLAKRAQSSRAVIRNVVANGVWGIGATARATTIINYCGLDVEDVPAVCEVSGSDKIGHYIPGTRIPVVDEAELIERQPARVVLFSWHLADSIIPKIKQRGYKGTIILPLPRVQHVWATDLWLRKEPAAC